MLAAVSAATRHALICNGHCTLCLHAVALLRAWDTAGVLEPVPFQDPALPARFPALTREACVRAVQLVSPDGRVWEGAAAIERALALLPFAVSLAWLFRLPLVSGFADLVYRAAARHRMRFQCGAHCAQGRP
jgi:predicted DCC family thiol-disulfide oxidoreductase YuxK